MKIAVASDHRGLDQKSSIIAQLNDLGHEGLDYGADCTDSCDYPDYAGSVAADVSSGKVDRGILICGTGIGMCITANKFAGVRATACHDEMTARMGRLHNDSNVLCLSADLLSDQLTRRMVDIWVETEFEGGRHERRLQKIAKIEEAWGSQTADA